MEESPASKLIAILGTVADMALAYFALPETAH
jgi:hypothetical protein